MTPLRSLPDLLAFLPYHVGFELRDALVVLGLEEARLVLVERTDLPDAQPLHPEALVRLVGGVRRLAPRLDTVLVVAYASEADPDPALPELVRALAATTAADSATASAAAVRAVVVSGSTWREWEDDVSRPLPRAADVPLVAEYVGRGIAPLADRAALRTALARTPSPEIDTAVRARADHGVDTAAGLRAWARLVVADLPGPSTGLPVRPSSGGVDVRTSGEGASAAAATVVAAATSVPVPGARAVPASATTVAPAATSTGGASDASVLDDVVTTLAFVSDVAHRDALLTRLVPLRGDPVDAPTSGAARVVAPGVVDGSSDDDPGGLDLEGPGLCGPGLGDPGLDALAVRVAVRATLVHLARVSPARLRATTLSMLAVWAWHCGDGALAAVASAVALEEEPGHALADLVGHLVRLDVPPPGAR